MKKITVNSLLPSLIRFLCMSSSFFSYQQRVASSLITWTSNKDSEKISNSERVESEKKRISLLPVFTPFLYAFSTVALALLAEARLLPVVVVVAPHCTLLQISLAGWSVVWCDMWILQLRFYFFTCVLLFWWLVGWDGWSKAGISLVFLHPLLLDNQLMCFDWWYKGAWSSGLLNCMKLRVESEWAKQIAKLSSVLLGRYKMIYRK